MTGQSQFATNLRPIGLDYKRLVILLLFGLVIE